MPGLQRFDSVIGPRKCRSVVALIVAAVLVLAAIGGVAASAAPGAHDARAPSADEENAFALALLRLVGGSGNVVYSPYSVDTALTMAGAGAEGPTATQIDRVVGAKSTAAANANAAALQHAMAAAAESGQSGAPKLELANAIWIQRGVHLQPPFVTTLSDTFGASPQTTDFEAAPQAARTTINGWVAQHTASLIRNLLPVGSVSPATVFVLANAVYLKANWITPFDTGLTHYAPFTLADGASVSVPFMSAPDVDYPYASAPDYQAVDLPYRSSSFSLLAILPTGEPLAPFEQTLTAASLASLVHSLSVRAVDLHMPKIDLQTQTALNAPLQTLGLTAAFSPSADFRGITTATALRISLVEHAADLKVDEQGTVAAAATGIIGPTAISQPRGSPVTVNLDRPYLLVLRDDTSGAILFVARVADPAAG